MIQIWLTVSTAAGDPATRSMLVPCGTTARAGGARYLTWTQQVTMLRVALRDSRAVCTSSRTHRLPRDVTSTDTIRAISHAMCVVRSSHRARPSDHGKWALAQIDQTHDPPSGVNGDPDEEVVSGPRTTCGRL